ncbi:MAG: hypothetical protein B6244_14795 [Candidatus Cloacimonetes bacterium 4572_55]|nr:MAG: hypothetical protein B6244_14795 [Candidatus Cloacimonetes bacterium 4572_55]
MAITVRCIKGTGNKEAPSISDALITSEGAAVSRGKRWLDDPSKGAYYLTKKRSLKFLHKGSHVIPRSWISVSDSHFGLKDKLLKIKSYGISITPTSVWATAETESYEEFTL